MISHTGCLTTFINGGSNSKKLDVVFHYFDQYSEHSPMSLYSVHACVIMSL